MENQVSFTLVTAEKHLVSMDADQVIVPARNGLVGILPRHTPMVFTLGAGLIALLNQGTKPAYYFITDGFCDVTSTSCTALVEHAYRLDQLDQAAIERDNAELVKTIATQADPYKNLKSRQQLFINTAKLEALKGITYIGAIPEA